MRYVALLRGINVGGHRPVRMADLRTQFEAIGARDVATYIQSGNVAFTHKATPAALERTLAKTMDYLIDLRSASASLRASAKPRLAFALREAKWLAALVDSPPFPTDHLHVVFLPTTAPITVVATPPERYFRRGRDLYVELPNGAGRSKLAASLAKIEGATMRNWRTINALLALTATS